MNSRFGVAAFVLALIALFVALGEGAVAAGVVPLARHAVTADTATNALKLGGKTPAQVKTSLRGAQGPQGPKGDPGPQGPSGSSSVSVHTTPFSLATEGTTGDEGGFTANCGAGQKAVSGGFESNGVVLGLDTRPTAADDGWQIYLANADDSAAHAGTVYAICFG